MWLRFALVIGLVLAALGAPAGANGIYIPEQAVLEMPRIPLQRGLITYRNGVETLVLESALTTTSKSVGWIVPLPGEPTKVSLGDRDMLRMLAVSQGPKVHDLSQYADYAMAWLIGITPLALAVVLTRNPVRRPIGVLAGILFCIVVYLVSPFRYPGSLGGSSEGVTVSAVHRLGDYEATVLRARTPGALDEWLGQQGLAGLNVAAKTVVTEYIARNWCFVVSRLATDTVEDALPRPLVMSFAAQTCVFPMRLTQLAGGTTRVELYVAADQQAQATGFKCVAADAYEYRSARKPDEHLAEGRYEYPVYQAKQIALKITNVDVQELLWDGCVVTHLMADLAAAQMTTDVAIGFGPLKAYREIVCTAEARWELTQIVGYWSAVAFVVVGAVVFAARRVPGRIGRASLIVVLAMGTLAIAGIYGFLPVVPVVKGVFPYDYYMPPYHGTLQWAANEAFMHGHLNADTPDEQVLGAIKAEMIDRSDIYRCDYLDYVGKALRFERTPGHVSTRLVYGQRYLCIYDYDGGEHRTLLPIVGTTQPVEK